MKLVAKRLIVAALTLCGLVVIGIGARYEMNWRAKEEARKEREASYEERLRAYSQVLKPGMNRREVEEYLRKQNRTFVQMCCVNRTERVGPERDDLTLIGKENAPWYCAEYNVYVAFEFDGQRHGSDSQPNALDALKAVSIYRWLERCL